MINNFIKVKNADSRRKLFLIDPPPHCDDDRLTVMRLLSNYNNNTVYSLYKFCNFLLKTNKEKTPKCFRSAFLSQYIFCDDDRLTVMAPSRLIDLPPHCDDDRLTVMTFRLTVINPPPHCDKPSASLLYKFCNFLLKTNKEKTPKCFRSTFLSQYIFCDDDRLTVMA